MLVVLLIYEYMITAETKAVQRRCIFNKTKFIGSDKPIADRLDRSHFGFDQEFYERMPLLVNALQEISYLDSSVEMSASRLPKRSFNRNRAKSSGAIAFNKHFVRKSNPRPFTYEYISPYPMPFTKSNGNPISWVEQYRNAQRLKNLHEVVKYLEKTLNAKFGDLYLPTRPQMSYSGPYLPPSEYASSILSENGSENIQKVKVKSNHYSDTLHTFKPNSPGDVNSLADGFRFSPPILPLQNQNKNINVVPLFRFVTKSLTPENCEGTDCKISNIMKNTDDRPPAKIKNSHHVHIDQPKPIDILSNIFSSQPSKVQDTINNDIDNIYITTSKPMFQFKRKSNIPTRRHSFKYPRPKNVIEKKKNITITNTKTHENKTITLKRLVLLSIYTPESNTSHNMEPKAVENSYADTNNVISTTVQPIKYNYFPDYPQLNFSHVEDYHIGSSGIIPVEVRHSNPPPSHIVTPIPFMDNSEERQSTSPPEIIKFNPEDAKVPDHYINLRKFDVQGETEKEVTKWDYSEIVETSSEDIETETLVIKLRNVIDTTTKASISTELISTEIGKLDSDNDTEMTTYGTYVPQINGHYRNLKLKSLPELFRENSERYRKKRIESLITTRTSPTYAPTYVEIKRNRDSTERTESYD